MAADSHGLTTAEDRLVHVGRLARLSSVEDAVRAVSHSNDAWLLGDLVVRICWRGDTGRLLREATVLDHLPDNVPHAPVIDHGADDGIAWMLTGRVRGDILMDLWDGFDRSRRRMAIAQISEAFAALHAWNAPTAVRRVLTAHEHRRRTEPDDIVGAFLVPLPAPRLRRLVAACRERERVPEAVADDLIRLLAEVEPHDPFANPNEHVVVVHGDAHLRNVLWHDGRLAAVLDFEWVRLGASDLELEAWLRYGGEDIGDLFASFREAYPVLFGHPALAERLRLYELAFLVRQTLAWPADEGLLLRLRRAVGSDARISAVLRAAGRH